MTKLIGRAAIDNLLGLDYVYLWSTDRPCLYLWPQLMRRTNLVAKMGTKESTGKGGGRSNGNINNGKGSGSGGASDGRSSGSNGTGDKSK